METNKEKIVLAFVGLILLVGLVSVLVEFRVEKAVREAGVAVGAGDELTKLGSPVSTKVAVAASSTSPTLLLATSTARKYVAIVNTATNTLTVCPSVATCTQSTGIVLNASGGSYEITSENLYFGAIYGILSTSHADVALNYQQ